MVGNHLENGGLSGKALEAVTTVKQLGLNRTFQSGYIIDDFSEWDNNSVL
jgi:hypothetical protein